MIGTLAQKRRTAALAAIFILALAAMAAMLLAGVPAGPAQAQSGGINLTATSLSVDENDEYWQYFQLSLASAPDGYVGINVEVDSQTNARFVVGVTNSYGQFVDCEAGETCYIHINDDEWDDQQVVYVNALIDDNRSGGSGKIKITAESGDPDYDGVTGEVSLTEYDTVGAAMLFPDGRPSYISEGGNASFSVQLAVEPYHDVTVTVSSSDPDITVAQGASLTFTASNYSSKQWVRLDAKEDDIALTAQSTIAVKSESDDNDYDLSGSFTITEIENDTARFVLSGHQSSLTVPEGGSRSYSVRLNSQPSANVTVTVSHSGDSDITVSPTSLEFTADNYTTAQNVTVRAKEDDGEYTNETATITHRVTGASEYSSQGIGNIAVTARDNDAAIFVDTDPNTDGDQTTLALAEGGSSATYTVRLSNQPSADVTVSITENQNPSTGNVKVTSSKSLTFTTSTWGAAQTVTVRAYNDQDAINGTPTINHSASGGGFDNTSASVDVTERDTAAAIILTDAATNGNNVSRIDVTEKKDSNDTASATYYVSLGAQPAQNVTVTLATTGDHGITFDTDDQANGNQDTLTFDANDYSTGQKVTLAAASDDVVSVNVSAAITHTAESADMASPSGYDGAPVKTLTAREIDKTGGITVSATTVNVPEGDSETYTVVLTDKPTGGVTVRLALQSDGDTNISRSPSTLYFNTGNWLTPQTVTVRASQDSDKVSGTRTISHTASGGGYNVTTPVVVTAREQDDEAGFVFTDSGGSAIQKLSVPEGGTATTASPCPARPRTA